MGFESDDAIMLASAKDDLAQGKRKAAYETLQALLARSPQNADAWYQLNFTLSDPEKRIKALQRSLKANPDHADALQLYMQLAEPDDAQALPIVTGNSAAAAPTAYALPQPTLAEIASAPVNRVRRTTSTPTIGATELTAASTMEVQALRVMLETPPEGSFTRRLVTRTRASLATIQEASVSFVTSLWEFLQAQLRHPVKIVMLVAWLLLLIAYPRLLLWLTLLGLAVLYERERRDVWQTLGAHTERLATEIPARWQAFRTEFASLETEEKIGVVVGSIFAIFGFWLVLWLLARVLIGW